MLVVSWICSAAACRLMRRVTAGGPRVIVADLYNSASGTWSTAQLSVARSGHAATSVGNVAIFAGGYSWTGDSNLCPLLNGCRGGSCLWESCV